MDQGAQGWDLRAQRGENQKLKLLLSLPLGSPQVAQALT